MIDLTELKEAEKKATPGPWVLTNGEAADPTGIIDVIDPYYDYENSGISRPDDAHFIALSRNLCRPMIEEIERLRTCKELLQVELGKANYVLGWIKRFAIRPEEESMEVKEMKCIASEALRSIDASELLK